METKDILNHHLTAFGNNDLDEILKDYTEDSEVLTSDGLLKGLTSIRDFFEKLFVTIPTGSFFEMKQLIVSGNLAYIVWASESKVAKIPFGTDSFYVEENKIKFHTLAAYVLEK
jgi:ketosteroid isomerase-like protein